MNYPLRLRVRCKGCRHFGFSIRAKVRDYGHEARNEHGGRYWLSHPLAISDMRTHGRDCVNEWTFTEIPLYDWET